ncbi:hypothetical protein LTR16_010797, partial [Cryomyces antarcticus]
MHDLAVRIRPDGAAAEALMADATVVFLPHHHPPAAPAAATTTTTAAASLLPEQQLRLGRDLLDGAQARRDALLAHDAVGAADAAAEVGFQLTDGKAGRDEVERAAGGQAGAVLAQQVEGRGPGGFVRRGRGEVEGEQGVVDAWLGVFGVESGKVQSVSLGYGRRDGGGG